MQQTKDCNKIASIDASFIFTSSELAGLLKPTVSETFSQNIIIFISSKLAVYLFIGMFAL